MCILWSGSRKSDKPIEQMKRMIDADELIAKIDKGIKRLDEVKSIRHTSAMISALVVVKMTIEKQAK